MAYKYELPERNTKLDVQNFKYLTGVQAAAKALHFEVLPWGQEGDEDGINFIISMPLPIIVMGRRRFNGLMANLSIRNGQPYSVHLHDYHYGSRGSSNRNSAGYGIHPHVTGHDFCEASSLQNAAGLFQSGRYQEAMGVIMAVAGSSSHSQPGIWLCSHCGRDVDYGSTKCYTCNNLVCGRCHRICDVCGERVCKECQAEAGNYCRRHANVVQCAGCRHSRAGQDMAPCPSCKEERCNRGCRTLRCGKCRQVVCQACYRSWNGWCKACQAAWDAQTKVCADSRCDRAGQSLPLTEFSRHSRTADGYTVRCKQCIARDHEEVAKAIFDQEQAAAQPVATGLKITGYAVLTSSSSSTTTGITLNSDGTTTV